MIKIAGMTVYRAAVPRRLKSPFRTHLLAVSDDRIGLRATADEVMAHGFIVMIAGSKDSASRIMASGCEIDLVLICETTVQGQRINELDPKTRATGQPRA